MSSQLLVFSLFLVKQSIWVISECLFRKYLSILYKPLPPTFYIFRILELLEFKKIFFTKYVNLFYYYFHF